MFRQWARGVSLDDVDSHEHDSIETIAGLNLFLF